MAPKTDGEKIWEQVLRSLELQMSKAAFANLFQGSVAISYADNTLTVGVRNVNAQQWIEKRYFENVEREVRRETAAETALVFTQLPTRGKEQEQPVEIEGVYREARNNLIQPHKASLVTDYFRRKWLPLLGPTLGWLVVGLRRRAYRNYKTGETRDGFRCTYNDLAIESGVTHWRTVSRALKKPCTECKKHYGKVHPVAEHFILEHTPVYQTSKRFSRHVRVGTRFRVYFDDELTPADEKRAKSST